MRASFVRLRSQFTTCSIAIVKMMCFSGLASLLPVESVFGKALSMGFWCWFSTHTYNTYIPASTPTIQATTWKNFKRPLNQKQILYFIVESASCAVTRLKVSQRPKCSLEPLGTIQCPQKIILSFFYQYPCSSSTSIMCTYVPWYTTIFLMTTKRANSFFGVHFRAPGQLHRRSKFIEVLFPLLWGYFYPSIFSVCVNEDEIKFYKTL